MRKISTLILATAILLGSASTTLSRTDNRDFQRCDAGLDRNVAVCNNLHAVGSWSWQTCLSTSMQIHKVCVQDAIRRTIILGDG